jgi:protein TonB
VTLAPAWRIHPVAWAAALALHLALASLAMQPAAPLVPRGVPMSLGIADLGGWVGQGASAGSVDAPAAASAPPQAVAAAMPPPSPDATPAAVPRPVEVPAAEPIVAPPPPAPPVPDRVVTARRATPAPAARMPQPGNGAPAATQAASAQAEAQEGRAPAGAAGSAEVVRLPGDYATAIARILQRGLRYPAAARDQAIEGVAMVQFAIARDGTVIGPRLLQGSGSVLLDHEAVALLRRVSPLPRLPDSVPGAQASVVVPVGFQLR